MNFYFFCLGVAGEGISGGDRIFIEFAKRWSKKQKVSIVTSSEGAALLKSQKFSWVNLSIFKISNNRIRRIFFLNYVYKIAYGVMFGLFIRIRKKESERLCFYSCSEFWMDSLPAFILKIRYPASKWVAAWYQTAPNPFRGYSEGERENAYNFKALLYWLVQLPIKPLIANFADYVLVNNELERMQFSKLNKNGKVVVVIGAVDLTRIKKWRKTQKIAKKTYDAVFQGRFHPQKGVVELVDIWRRVVDKKPGAKLAMIGDGPLMSSVKSKVRRLGLEENINLFGYVFDGNEKYKIFSESKIVVHPAFYDSGGMAAAEAMAFGLPCVGFNLRSYESYYPKGLVKVGVGDLEVFAKQILKLLSNAKYRERIGSQALVMIESNWSWDKRASEVLNKIKL